jgi:hypothetical protein
MFIDEFGQYTTIDRVVYKTDIKSIIQIFYNFMETQFSAKIMKLKSDNRGEYLNQEMTGFLETIGNIHDLSTSYTNESNGLSN